MAVDQFLKLEGIDGESKDDAHPGEIDVLSWSWGASNSADLSRGGGGGAGKVNLSEVGVVKYVDKSSPVLLKYCCIGEHIPSATLTVRKFGGTAPIEYVVIDFKHLVITSYQTGGSGGEDSLTENLSFGFEEATVKYQPQKEDGTKDGGTVDFGFNVKTNKPV